MTNAEIVTVRVSAAKRKYTYVNFAKHRLHEGAPEVMVSGLGSAIPDAVSVVELLKNQGLVVVKKISTSRGEVDGGHTAVVEKIEIIVSKSDKFDALYAEDQKRREEAAEKNAEEAEE